MKQIIIHRISKGRELVVVTILMSFLWITESVAQIPAAISVLEVTTCIHDTKTMNALISVPEGEGPFPVIMLIHGGAFGSGDRTRFDESLIEHYIKMDIAVMSVEYRLVLEGGQHPEAIKDCMHNLCWLIDHSAEYRFDTSRVVVQGSSAGSYLSMMLALTSERNDFRPDFGPYQDCKVGVKAVISCAAMYDWTAINNGDNYIGTYRDNLTASPVNLARFGTCHHFLLLGGDSDTNWSPPNSAKLMQANLEAAGKTCELYLKANQTHPALYDDFGEFPRWAFPIIDAFLKKFVLF